MNVLVRNPLLTKSLFQAILWKYWCEKRGSCFPLLTKKMRSVGINLFISKYFYLTSKKPVEWWKFWLLGTFFPKYRPQFTHFYFCFLQTWKKIEVETFFQVGWVTGNINLFFSPDPTVIGSCSESFFSTYLKFSGCTWKGLDIMSVKSFRKIVTTMEKDEKTLGLILSGSPGILQT